MSVWPNVTPASPSLSTREGDLVSISINVDPRSLEALLEALAQVGFPVNPQIYHDAAMVYLYADNHQEVEATTLVEFPAYASHLEEVSRALEVYGFDPSILQVTSMLHEIHSECSPEPAPAGAAYRSRYRIKHRLAAAG